MLEPSRALPLPASSPPARLRRWVSSLFRDHTVVQDLTTSGLQADLHPLHLPGWPPPDQASPGPMTLASALPRAPSPGSPSPLPAPAHSCCSIRPFAYHLFILSSIDSLKQVFIECLLRARNSVGCWDPVHEDRNALLEIPGWWESGPRKQMRLCYMHDVKRKCWNLEQGI